MIADVLVRWLLSITLVVSSSPRVEAQDTIDGLQASLDQAESYVKLLKNVRSAVDRKRFDLEALIEYLDFDAEAIIQFVTQEVAFEQYPGLLRGPKGTLASQSGNALDQAVLLAKLLKDAGFDARVAKGTLTPEQSALLLAQISAPEQQAHAIADMAALKALYTSENGLDDRVRPIIEALSRVAVPEVVMDTYVSAAERQMEFLTEALKSADQNLPIKDTSTTLAEEASGYFWVQYRFGAASPWADVHPAVRSGDLGAVQMEVAYANTVPSELQHRLAFEVVATQSIGGRLTEHVLVPRWERPAANLLDEQFSFYLHSRHLATQANEGRTLAAPGDWNDVLIPVWNGRAVGSAVDLAGNVIDLEAAASPFAGIFQTVQRKALDGVSMLSSAGTDKIAPQPAMYLKAVTLKFTLVAPGGASEEYVRTLYEYDGQELASQDLRDAQYRSLTKNTSFSVLLGSYHPAYVLDQLLGSMIDNSAFLAVITHRLLGSDITALPPDALPDGPPRWIGLEIMPEIFDNVPREKGLALYRAKPTLITHTQSLAIGQRVIEAFDIIQNNRRAVQAGETELDTRSAMLAGVWETLTEGLLVGDETSKRYTTASLFELAADRGIGTRVLAPADVPALVGLDLPRAATERIRQDLERGFTVVIPERLVDFETNAVGWWRIHGETGQTLGMVSRGNDYGGVELSEGVVLGIIVSVLLLFATSIFQYYDCDPDAENPSAQTICRFCAMASAIIGGGAAAAGISKNPVPAIIAGVVAGFLGMTCAFMSLLDYEHRPDPEY